MNIKFDEYTPDVSVVHRISKVIGVDAGSHTGVVYWHLERGRVEDWHLGDFWSAHDWIRVFDPYNTLIIIEDPNKIPPTFKRAGQSETAMKKIAGDVGKNKREASLLVKRFREYGYTVWTPSPKGMGPKFKVGEFINKAGIDDPDQLKKLKQKNHGHVWDALRAVISQLRFFNSTS